MEKTGKKKDGKKFGQPGKYSDIYEALMREKKVIYDGIKSSDTRTRQALAKIIQTVQKSDEPPHVKKAKLRVLNSFLSSSEENTKKIENNELLLANFISRYYKESPQRLTILKQIFDYAHQDELREMTKDERRNLDSQLTPEEQYLLHLITASQRGKKKEAALFEATLLELKMTHGIGLDVMGLLTCSLGESYKHEAIAQH